MPLSPPVDKFFFAKDRNACFERFPMDMYLCNTCGHAQLLDVVSPEVLFGDYIYTSSSSPDLDTHFENYALDVIANQKLESDSFIVDVGSNDGLFLSKFSSRGFKVLGIEPADYPASLAIKRGIPTERTYLTSQSIAGILSTHGPADVVTANNVFSHNDDLRGFATNIRDLLKPNGMFVFEVSYLLSLVENRVADYIYHEHLAHHSVLPLKLFFESLNMKLVRVDRVNTKGGSIRGYACLQSSDYSVELSVDELISTEQNFGLYKHETYQELQNFYSHLKGELTSILEPIFVRGGLIASYGASATATVFNLMMDVDKYISFTIDDNQMRQARLTPSSRIPVVSREMLLVHMPEIVIISSWRFADMIINNNQEYLSRGGNFIVPQPSLKLVSKLD